MEWVNEGSYHKINIPFVDLDGNAVRPDTASYRIDDLLSETEIKETTFFNPESTSYDLEIPGELNVIVDDTQRLETRVVTIAFYYGDRVGTFEHRYWLKNLKFLELAAESS